jgi:signal recognition particle subunit SRP54
VLFRSLHFSKNTYKPLLVAADIYRPAAVEQLRTLGRQLNIEVFHLENTPPLAICQKALQKARESGHDLVILDTAGRLHIDQEMMAEIRQIKEKLEPEHIFFVADAMTGQDAVNVAQEFHNQLQYTGVVLTKMDGDARGGAALSILEVTGVPIRFVSNGEKPEALEIFHPDRMAQRILGMGDIISLVEKAQESMDIEKAQALEKKMRKNTFDLEDLRDQLRQIKKMGPIENVLSMIPGLGGQLNPDEMDPKQLPRMEAIIGSMTAKERRKPMILNGSRRLRIAKGSGTTVQEVNRLLKQYEQMQKMMKRFSKMGPKLFGKIGMRGMFGG